MLSEAQVDRLCEELHELTEATHPGNSLFYEYNSNESADRARCCFMRLGPGGSRRAFTIFCGTRPSPCRPRSCSAAPCGSGTTSCSASRRGTAAWWPGTRTIRIGRGTQPMAHLTCWIGLDDATRDNGCLQYVPGSHRWQLLPVTGLAGDMNAIQTVLSPEQQAGSSSRWRSS